MKQQNFCLTKINLMRKTFTLMALLLAFICHQVIAQERTISGTVISSQDNLGIPGASVVIPGTTKGAITDIDGKFSLQVPTETKTLKISALGMKTKDVELTTSSTLNVTLEPNITKLNEVVVTANAIVREKRSLGYATQQVSSSELNSGENSNIIGALQGKVAGVNITSLSGSPGSSQRIVLRGGSSLTRENQPLIVIDGVPIDNRQFRTDDDLNNQVDYGVRANDINPDDIESISVLKGPGAAAQYGSRAANGAIMITTKKGKRAEAGKTSKMEISFHSNLTLSNVLKFPEFQNKYGQGDLSGIQDDRRENFSWGLPFDDKLRPWGQEIDGKQRVKPYSALEDNTKDFFNTGTSFTNNIAFGGGSEKSTYYFSVSSLKSKGIVPTTTYDKYNILFNGSTQLNNHFSSSISLNYSNISSMLPTGGQQDQSIYSNLLQTPRDIPITEGENLEDPFNAYNDITGEYGFYAAYALNPYFVLENFKNDNNVDRVFGNISVSYSKWSWLTITNRLGGDIYSDRRTQKWKKYNYLPIDAPYYSLLNNNQNYQGKYSEDIYNLTSYNNDLMFNFNHKFKEDLTGTLILGYNVRQRVVTNTFAQTNPQSGLGIPGYYNLDNSAGPVDANNSLSKIRNYGYYADFNFALKNMIFLGLNGRFDKSSTLPADNNTYFYPGVNTSFVASELFNDKLKDNLFNYCKIRVSYAKVGNDADPYLPSNFYTRTEIDGGWGTTSFPFNDIIGYSTGNRLGNTNIKPEFSTEFEVGTDLSFLDNRLSVGASYYIKNSKDQIFNLPISPATGFSSQTVNAGEVENKGIEIEISGFPLITKSGVKWELFGTYYKNKNKVISLFQGVDQLILGGFSGFSIVNKVGEPQGAFYAVDLLTNSQGQVIVDSATGNPKTTPNLINVGNYQPDFQMSWGTEITYKGISFGFLFDMKSGGSFFSRTKDLLDFVGTSKESENRDIQVYPNSVYIGADGQTVANTTPYNPYDYYTASIPAGRHVIDASYTKLREVHLSYQLPLKWLTKTPFGSASIGVVGNNLYLWTPEENKYTDPELNSSGASNAQGFEYLANPSQRNFGFDLKVTF